MGENEKILIQPFSCNSIHREFLHFASIATVVGLQKCLLFSLPWHVLLKIGQKSPTLKVAWTGDPPFAYLPGSGQNSYLATVTESIFIYASQTFSYPSRFFCLSILLTRRVPAYRLRPRLTPRNHIVRSTRLDEAHWTLRTHKDDV
jgi:hypothetical protein